MQKTKKQTKAQNHAESHPAVDDFFTQFLDKKKRNYTKKLDKIDALQKKNYEELTPEQKDLVNNRQKVVEKANHYEDIKKLYFKANSKRDSTKTNKCGDLSDCVHTTLSLYYLGNSAKESGENAMRVLSAHGVDFQEKVHKYHNKVFHANHKNAEELKKAEETLSEYLKDSEVSRIVCDIVSEGKLTETQQTHVKETQRKESHNKPQLFAMSSDEEDEEHEVKEEKKTESHAKGEHHDEFKPTFVPLPEDDAEEGFAFQGEQGNSGNRRGRRPRGDKPYRKYDGEKKERREPREKKPETEGVTEQKDGEDLGEKPSGRGRGYRTRNPDKIHEENREKGDRRKPFGRGRGKHYNKERRDDNDYQKKEGHVE